MSEMIKASSILLLVASILSFIVGGIFVLIVGAMILIGMQAETSEPLVSAIIFVFIAIVMIASAILKLWASKLVKKKETLMKGSLIALITGVVTGPDMLSVVAGILGLIENGKK